MAKKAEVKTSSVPSPLPPYIANEKTQFSFLMSEDFQERVNIAWRVEEAEKDPKNPLVEPKYEWDGLAFSCTARWWSIPRTTCGRPGI